MLLVHFCFLCACENEYVVFFIGLVFINKTTHEAHMVTIPTFEIDIVYVCVCLCHEATLERSVAFTRYSHTNKLTHREFVEFCARNVNVKRCRCCHQQHWKWEREIVNVVKLNLFHITKNCVFSFRRKLRKTMAETKNEEFDQNGLQDMLKIYYKRLFPRQIFYRWLTYNHSKCASVTYIWINK